MGNFDAVDSKVKFGPFLDSLTRNLTYDITPTATATGSQNFIGSASFDGTMIDITGIRNIDKAPPELADVIKGLQILIGVDVDIHNCLSDADGNGKVEINDILENLLKIAGIK